LSEGGTPGRGFRATVAHGVRVLHPDQRLAGLGALGLIASMFLPWWRDPLSSLSYWAVNRFTFLELAMVLVAGSMLLLLYGRAEGRGFHLPLSDGTLAAGAGIWCCLLVLARIADPPTRVLADRTFDYELRWGFLIALGSAVLLAVAGVRGRRRYHRGQSEALAADVDAETAHAWGEPAGPGPP
jgi:hypothetical protein